MNRTDPIIHAHAVFGTAGGLTVAANGILASPMVHGRGLFDLGESRSTLKSLSAGGSRDMALFRKRIATTRDQHYELIGLFGPCKDHSGRDGLFGSCVALGVDRLQPKVAVHDWTEAFEVAYSLFLELKKNINANGEFEFPTNLALPAEPTPVEIGLKPLPDSTLELHMPEAALQFGTDTIDLLQACAFGYGDQTPSILIYPHQINNSHSINDPQFSQMVASFEAKVTKAENAAKARVAQSQSRPAPAPQAAQRSHAQPQQPAYAASNLEYRVRQLEADVEQLYDHLKSGGASPQSRPPQKRQELSFPEIEEAPFWQSRAFLWICFLLLIVFIIGGGLLAWFLRGSA